MRRTKALSFLLPLLLVGLASCSIIAPVRGVNGCIISVVPLEPTGGWLYMAAQKGGKEGTVIVQVDASQGAADAEIEFYDPSGGTLWKKITTQERFRFYFEPESSSQYKVRIEKESGPGNWSTVWQTNQAWDTSGTWDMWTWKKKDISVNEKVYLISFGGGRSAGFAIKGHIQNLTI